MTARVLRGGARRRGRLSISVSGKACVNHLSISANASSCASVRQPEPRGPVQEGTVRKHPDMQQKIGNGIKVQ